MKSSAGCKQKQQEENDTTLIKLFKIRDKEKTLEANRMKLLQRLRCGFLLGNDASEETQTPLGH